VDHAILSAVTALVGSLIGGVSTFAAYWMSQRIQTHHRRLMQQAVIRETLYAEFIVEASRRLADAWSHGAEGPQVIANLYSAVQRMRLTFSSEVVSAAERVMQAILDAYAEPDKSFDELRQTIRGHRSREWLSEFSEVCRKELIVLTDANESKSRGIMQRVGAAGIAGRVGASKEKAIVPSCRQHCRAANAGVTVRRIGRVLLVGTADPLSPSGCCRPRHILETRSRQRRQSSG
jgi:hypothetical protein